MGMPVVTVASGGLPIVESTVGGTPVTEATNGRGVAVTKVVGKPGMPVVFETIGIVAVPTTWNPSDKSANFNLSAGNLTAASTSGAGGGVRGINGRTSAKIYFEILYVSVAGGASSAAGIALSSADLALWMGNGLGGICIFDNGGIFRNGASVGVNVGSVTASKRHCIAVDMTAKRFWARVDAGIWNASAGNDPATGVGGIDISAVFTAGLNAFPAYGASFSGNSCTANFGATAFAQTIPSGFVSWNAGS
jgi:hypothetical protein